jgi:hypothetical protein
MLEIARFILSAIVAQAYIWPLNVPWLAWQAVFAFYILSGFLMTAVCMKNMGSQERRIAFALAASSDYGRRISLFSVLRLTALKADYYAAWHGRSRGVHHEAPAPISPEAQSATAGRAGPAAKAVKQGARGFGPASFC